MPLDEADLYGALRLQHLFVELRGTEADTRRRLQHALEEVGVDGWRIEERPRVSLWDRERVAWRVLPPVADSGGSTSSDDAWTLAHGLARRVDGEVEPVFEGDVVPVLDGASEGLEGGRDGGPPPDVGWHLSALRVSGESGAHAIFAQRHPNRVPGEGVRIGHPDTGYTKHAEIWAGEDGPIDASSGNNYLEPGEDPLDPMEPGAGRQPGHGTSTSSVMVARSTADVPSGVAGWPEAVNLIGIAPGARVAPFRVTRSVLILGWQSRLAGAIELAAQSGCRVISMSLGGLGGSELDWAIETAEALGVIVVAAAGNYVPFVVAPANHPKVVGCAATGPHDRPWRHSATGMAVKISAPGHRVWVAGWENEQAVARLGSGTSFATAAVASAAALWLSYHDKAIEEGDPATAPMFRAALKRAARRVEGLPHDRFGPGVLDVAELLRIPLDRLRADVEQASVEALAATPSEPLSRMARHELEMHRLLDPELARATETTFEAPIPRASSGLALELEKARQAATPASPRHKSSLPPREEPAPREGPASRSEPQAGSRKVTISLEIVLEIDVSVKR